MHSLDEGISGIGVGMDEKTLNHYKSQGNLPKITNKVSLNRNLSSITLENKIMR